MSRLFNLALTRLQDFFQLGSGRWQVELVTRLSPGHADLDRLHHGARYMVGAAGALCELGQPGGSWTKDSHHNLQSADDPLDRVRPAAWSRIQRGAHALWRELVESVM
jgi:photosystem II stability/assembly factor-like uncharacterized protein